MEDYLAENWTCSKFSTSVLKNERNTTGHSFSPVRGEDTTMTVGALVSIRAILLYSHEHNRNLPAFVIVKTKGKAVFLRRSLNKPINDLSGAGASCVVKNAMVSMDHR